jgi:hypothetical protein
VGLETSQTTNIQIWSYLQTFCRVLSHTLVKLFSLALNSTEKGHAQANDILQKDIDNLKIKK